MIIERRRQIPAPPEQVLKIISDPEQLSRLMPRAEQVEIVPRPEGRARVSITMRAGPLGRRRIDGEARPLPDGLRFIAVVPVEIDMQITVKAAESGSEVTSRLDINLAKLLGPLARLMPKTVLDREVGQQLDDSLNALEQLAVPAGATDA
ncbi:MAG: hypothetical protein NVS2B7_09430 [Herpetosiphon sp.]